MFTPVHTSLGALLLFQGSSGLLYHNGAVFGISSLLSGAILRPSKDNVPTIVGLVSSVIPVYLLAPSLIPEYPLAPDSVLSAAATFAVGLLLGWGTKVRIHVLITSVMVLTVTSSSLEWPRLYFGSYALWIIPIIATFVNCNICLLHHCARHSQHGGYYTLMWDNPMLYSRISVASRTYLHHWSLCSLRCYECIRGSEQAYAV